MDKKLRKIGLINSSLLAISFVSIALQSAASGSAIMAIISLLAVGFTVRDAAAFYNAK